MPLKMEKNDREERRLQALARVGHGVYMAVERFMTVGEIIAEDNPEIKTDMYESCRDARDSGKSIEYLCKISKMEGHGYQDIVESLCDFDAITVAARSLLSSITRVLLLVDIVIVKQLLTAKRKISKSMDRLESVLNFTEFVRAFSIFGMEMIELAYVTGNTQNSLKEERRRAQLLSASQILEHSITILLTSSKTSLLHGECLMAKENRDTVFCQIRRAMDLIHYAIKDSILNSTWFMRSDDTACCKIIENGTIYSALKHFTFLMETYRYKTKDDSDGGDTLCMANNNDANLINPLSMSMQQKADQAGQGGGKYQTDMSKGGEVDKKVKFKNNTIGGGNGGSGNGGGGGGGGGNANKYSTASQLGIDSRYMYTVEAREQLLIAFDKLIEKTYDFTDSAYTSHENRENILMLCERCKVEFNKYLNNMLKNDHYMLMDKEIDHILDAVKHLSKQLVLSAADQVMELHHSLKMSVELADSFRMYALKKDIDSLQERANKFHDYCDHVIDVCKLLQQIAFSETLQVQVKYLAINLRIYGPQVLTAAKILAMYPTSNPANENFDAFVDMWKWLTFETTYIVKEILKSTNKLNEPGLGYLGIPPQRFVISDNALEAPIPPEGGDKDEFSDIEKGSTEANPFSEKYSDSDDVNDNNDIIKRAKNMSAMAFLMYQFTKGNGTLRTTQDLFTQAEYFAEEANRLYKVLRQFSYQVPASQLKKDLLNILDRVPTFVQTLQFTVKDHTVGKAATFVKVDHVIRETKDLMTLINTVVTKCFECASKYKLDFSDLNGGLASGSLRGDDNSAGGMGDSKGITTSTEGNI